MFTLFSLRTWGLIGGVLLLLAGGGGPAALAQEAADASLHERAALLEERADSLRKARQYEAAMDVYRRARNVYRRLGDRGGEAKMTEEIGILFAYRHRYEKARSILERALDGHRTAGDEAALAKNLNNIAILYRRQGQYEEALTRYRKVLAMYDEEERSDRAFVLNNLGLVYDDMGQYSKALQRFREALEIQRALDDRAGRATSLDNIADILQNQGRYEDALRRYEEALKLYRALDKRVRVANTLSGIGNIHFRRGRYEQALGRYQEALRMYRVLDDRSRMADNLNNVGAAYRKQGREQEAMEALQQALQIHREIGRPGSEAISLNEIGSVYRERGAYETARAKYKEALRINRELGRSAHEATSLHRIGRLELEVGRYAVADSVLHESIRITETLFQTASGADRRDFLAKEMDRYHTLVTTQVRARRPAAALRTYERSRARLLTERLAGKRDSGRTVPSIKTLRGAIGPKEAAVLYANTGTVRPITVFIVTRDSVRAHEIRADTLLRDAGKRYQEAFRRLRTFEKRPWAPERPDLLQEAKGVHVDVGAKQQFAELVRLYRHELSMPKGHRVLSQARRETLGQFLYSALLDPIADELRSVDELVVVPDGAMSYLPLEAVSDWDETRTIEKWRIRYVQSLRVLHLLRKRHRHRAEEARRPLLALGDAAYEPTSYTVDTSGFGAQTTLITEPHGISRGTLSHEPDTRSAMQGRRVRRPETDSTQVVTYRARGYGPEHWHNLSSTLEEIRGLSRIPASSTVLLGRGAREQAVRSLSQTGALAEYRAVHFATHGFVVPDRPGLSALVLSEVGESRSSETKQRLDEWRSGPDGYLSMREIAQLDLRADFVGLSACQTGLGRIYRGSGAVSLAQGFLRAGAGSVAVSLWAVEDASTSRFMEAVYQRAWNGGKASWSEAVARTKRRFANGEYGERLQSPRFWAPFVYYGWDPGTASP